MVRSLQVEYLEINWTFFLNFCNFYHSTLGGIQQLHGQNFAIVCPPPLLGGQFLYLERGQNRHFLTPSPTHLVHVVIECPLIGYDQELEAGSR